MTYESQTEGSPREGDGRQMDAKSQAIVKVSNPLAVRAERDIIRAVAMDIGKQVAHHIETMYPEAVKAASSTFLLSVRNCTHNEIMGWIDTDIDAEKLLTFHDRFRRYIRSQYKKIRRREASNKAPAVDANVDVRRDSDSWQSAVASREERRASHEIRW